MKKEKILLVDDEAGIRKVLGISLCDSGYDVHTAENGAEALRIFRKVRPPIVLTDIKMPGMDGIALLQQIKRACPDTEVIMITGHGDIDLAIKSLKFEATDFITKPISDEALEVALKRARERISMRQQLREYTENLEQLVQEKTSKLIAAERLAAAGEAVAGLAHAIKNITSGLEGGTFVLEKGIELDHKKYLHQGWDMVRGNVEKIKNLSLDLLNYAKPPGANYQLCNPNEPAREVVDLMKSHAEKRGVDLKLDLTPGLKECYLDPEGIHRCLLNLVTNAIDACQQDSSKGKGKEVVVRTVGVNGWGVEYQVADNGSGMEKEVRKRLFTGFFTTKGTRGTGIGLMMTKKIIDEHKGHIEVDSEAGIGTRFTIRLPESGKNPRRAMQNGP